MGGGGGSPVHRRERGNYPLRGSCTQRGTIERGRPVHRRRGGGGGGGGYYPLRGILHTKEDDRGRPVHRRQKGRGVQVSLVLLCVQDPPLWVVPPPPPPPFSLLCTGLPLSLSLPPLCAGSPSVGSSPPPPSLF